MWTAPYGQSFLLLADYWRARYTVAYMEFESLHLVSLAFSFIVIAVADHDGWRYFRGKTATLQPSRVSRLHTLAWVGLGGMIISGIFLLLEEPDSFQEPLFFVKMLMVAALVVNGMFIGRVMQVATTTPFAQLTGKQRWPLLGSGAVSVGCWVGAAVLGFVM